MNYKYVDDIKNSKYGLLFKLYYKITNTYTNTYFKSECTYMEDIDHTHI